MKAQLCITGMNYILQYVKIEKAFLNCNNNNNLTLANLSLLKTLVRGCVFAALQALPFSSLNANLVFSLTPLFPSHHVAFRCKCGLLFYALDVCFCIFLSLFTSESVRVHLCRSLRSVSNRNRERSYTLWEMSTDRPWKSFGSSRTRSCRHCALSWRMRAKPCWVSHALTLTTAPHTSLQD